MNPDVKVEVQSSGDQLPTVLATAVQGGNPPDLAAIGQPGLMKDFAAQGALKPITLRARPTSRRTTRPSWVTLGTVNGKLYGLFFKGANKSTVWYNVQSFKNAGVKPPTTWPQLLARREDAARVGHARLLDRRRGRLDAHRPVREHLPPVRPGDEVRPADDPQDQVDRPVR